MTKIFLDTNVWLRFFLKDNDQYESVYELISRIEEGKFLSYTSNIVILEIIFVLEKMYSLPVSQIFVYLEAVRQVRNITLIEKTNTSLALRYLKEYGLKYADCLIASQLARGMTLVSFDKEFLKIKELTVKTPGQM